jgi:guanine nucleotide-binding protein subunit alpha
MCFGNREDADLKKSRDIDAGIHRDEKAMQRQVKLLLLGKFSLPTPNKFGASPNLNDVMRLWCDCTLAKLLSSCPGAGESGKSTILKQMRLIYTKDGFAKNEKEEWRVIIFNNILDGLRMCIDAMEEFGLEFSHENTTVSSYGA